MKRQLEQIRLFEITNSLVSVQDRVNDFVIQIFNEHGAFPNIDTNSKYITVKYMKSVEVDDNSLIPPMKIE